MTQVIYKASANIDLKVVSLEEFLALLPVKEFDDRVFGFNTLQYSGSVFDDGPLGDSVETYVRKAVGMVRGTERQIARNNILVQAKHHTSFRKPIQRIYEEMVVENAMKLGSADYIIKLGSRRYVTANLEDFIQVKGKQGYTLACTNEATLVVWEILPITEEEAKEKYYKAPAFLVNKTVTDLDLPTPIKDDVSELVARWNTREMDKDTVLTVDWNGMILRILLENVAKHYSEDQRKEVVKKVDDKFNLILKDLDYHMIMNNNG